MKKIIAFAMSALLAVSAAMPVIAQPAVPEIDKLPDANFQQARLVSAEELAQIRPYYQSKIYTIEETVVVEPKVTIPAIYTVDETDLKDAAATVNEKAVVKSPAPVVAYVTASTIVFEQVSGYRYGVSDGYWSVDSRSNVIRDLEPNTEYRCYLTRSGDPATIGESVTVVTGDRVPCLNTPKTPMVKEHTHNSITLVARSGYEYRIENGTWQNSPVFTGLEPETEYTFYQRIKQSNTELASEESQPLVAKTGFEGPSSAVNMARLRSFIGANGFVDEDGNKTVAFVITDDYDTEYYFLMIMREQDILFDVFTASDASDVLLFNTEFPLSSSTSQLRLDFSAALYAGDTCVDYAEDYLYAFMSEYKIGDPVTGAVSSTYLSSEYLSSLWSMTAEMLFSFWDEFLYTSFGFGFRGLGFVATEGFGDLFCHAPLQAHYGETELLYQREEECRVDASNGDPYCTLCGQKIKDSYKEPSRGYHVYDNSCDVDCNDCGHLRVIPHLYSFACDVECDICGAVRTDPRASHSFGEDLVCTKCGYKSQLLGDVSGDGKVNMGDVAKVYAHTRGRALITDPAALAAADTNGDGKINLGDTSRILAHITGKKLLW